LKVLGAKHTFNHFVRFEIKSLVIHPSSLDTAAFVTVCLQCLFCHPRLRQDGTCTGRVQLSQHAAVPAVWQVPVWPGAAGAAVYRWVARVSVVVLFCAII